MGMQLSPLKQKNRGLEDRPGKYNYKKFRVKLKLSTGIEPPQPLKALNPLEKETDTE